MHEFSIAQSIVETVIKVAQDNGASQILGVNLEVGEVAFVNVDQLGWHIQMLTQGLSIAFALSHQNQTFQHVFVFGILGTQGLEDFLGFIVLPVPQVKFPEHIGLFPQYSFHLAGLS